MVICKKIAFLYLLLGLNMTPILLEAQTSSPLYEIQYPQGRDNIVTIQGVNYQSKNFKTRDGHTPSILVLHYTAETLERSAYLLTSPQGAGVSSHYLVPEYTTSNSSPLAIYQLVADDKTAFHAGVSQWRGNFVPHPRTGKPTINQLSLGIEIVNHGYIREGKGDDEKPVLDANGNMQFTPFPDTQIDIVIDLCKQLKETYNLQDWNIVGHSDVALWPEPTVSKYLRKVDPGATFPWKKLAEKGVGMWPDLKVASMSYEQPNGADIIWTKKALARVGYCITDLSRALDDSTLLALNAFRLHYQTDAFITSYDATPILQWGNNPQDLITQDILYKLITQYAIPPITPEP